MRGRRLSIVARLFFAVGLPAAVVVAGLGFLAWRELRGAVRDSLARELSAQATIAASSLSTGSATYRVLLAGEEDSRTYRRLVAKLRGVAESTGSVRVMLVGADELVRGDDRGQLPLLSPAPRVALDRVEFARALDGAAAVGVPFRTDGGERLLAAYARVPEPPKEDEAPALDGVPLLLVLEAPAAALDAVDDVARTIAALVAGAVLLVLATAIVVARTITGPLATLARGAGRLATGDLKTRLEVPAGDDEVAVLGRALESMRAALAERDAERQMMLAGIAHEIRNPLGGMELFSGLLEEGVAELPASPERDELARQAGRVRKELRYLTGVVNDFLAFARDAPVQREETDVAALLEDVASLSRRDAAAAVVVEDGAVGAFALDRGKIKQALLNLVENALAATPPTGRVALQARRDGDDLVLVVADTGKGMSDEALARAFTPFFTTKEKGSGLGLPLVRKLARDHGGDATVASTSGVGTSVTLRLRPR